MRASIILALTPLLCGACNLESAEPPLPPGPNGACNPELTAALRAGDARQVDRLIARNAVVRCQEAAIGDPDRVRRWTTPLELAVETGQVAIVTAVLAAGAGAANHEIEVPAIYRAVRMKRPDLLNALLQAGASANSHSGCRCHRHPESCG
jgi:hypothetical protein